ncbi:NAD(P)H-dependent oxidoreductase [Actinomyces oris]|uniref:NAD(P)H-dependent oxidoreductase n=1 Tax=Actinomyces oris TaxID=544580 RepID=UPI0021169E11|nr:NAD(P)H-dependent oxidoreductase [Actinomyces oris]
MLAWGTPVYRHDMTGALKTVIERMNDEPTKRNRPDCPGRRQYVNAPLYPAWAER